MILLAPYDDGNKVALKICQLIITNPGETSLKLKWCLSAFLFVLTYFDFV